MANGWLPLKRPPNTHASRYMQTRTSVWCSDNWAKPPMCQHDTIKPMMPDGIGHTLLPSGAPGPPVRSVFGNRVEFIHNFKAASSAFSAFLSCAFGRNMDSTTFDISIFVVRDPIERFILTVGELLRRYVRGASYVHTSTHVGQAVFGQAATMFWRASNRNASMPAAQVNDHCPPDENGPVKCSLTMQPAFWPSTAPEFDYVRKRQETLEEAKYLTHWWPLASARGVGPDVLVDLLSAFIDDLQCCHSAYAMEFFSAQSLFATYATRGVDIVIQLQNLEAGINELRYRVPGPDPALIEKCKPLLETKIAETNNGSFAAGVNFPSTSALRAALTEEHFRRLCEIYRQDYACFDFDLPSVCPPLNLSDVPPYPPAPDEKPPPPPAWTGTSLPRPSLLSIPPLPPAYPNIVFNGVLRRAAPPLPPSGMLSSLRK